MVSPGLTLTPGLRADLFHYSPHEPGTTATLTPRLSARWDLNEQLAVKAGLGLYSQGARNGGNLCHSIRSVHGKFPLVQNVPLFVDKRGCDFCTSDVNADRGSRGARISRPSFRLLDLEQLHANPLIAAR